MWHDLRGNDGVGVMSAGKSQELKSCQSLLAKQKGELEVVEKEFQTVSQKRGAIKATIKELTQRIQKLSAKSEAPIVSEHALLRYFERVGGLSLEIAISHILTKPIIGLIDEYGSGTFPSENGFKVVVKNRTVVSILAED